MTKNTERKNGYYWIKFNGSIDWVILLFDSDCWWNGDDPVHENAIGMIYSVRVKNPNEQNI